jgi:hypothetical protein
MRGRRSSSPLTQAGAAARCVSPELGRKEDDARDIGTGSIEACHEAAGDRIGAEDKKNGDCRSGRFCLPCRLVCRNDGHLSPNQLADETRHTITMILGIAIFNCDVLALDKSRLSETLAKSSGEVRRVRGRRHAQKPDHRYCTLLGARGKRPHAERRCASQKRRSEVTPSHCRPRSNSFYRARARHKAVVDYETAYKQATRQIGRPIEKFFEPSLLKPSYL